MAKAQPFPPAWRDSIRDYQADQFANNMEPRTVDLRLQWLSKLAAVYPDGPAEIETKHLRMFVGSNPRWNDSTRRTIQNSFKSYFKWAKKAKYTKGNPSKDLRSIPQRKTAGLAVPKKTIKEALAGAKDARSALMVRLNSHGLAAMEIAQARPSDVFEKGGDFYLRVYGKKAKSEDVPIPPDLAKALRAIDREYVFTGRINGHVSPAYVSRLISAELPPGVSSRNVRGTQRASLGVGQPRTWPDVLPVHSPDSLGFMELPDLMDSEALNTQLRRLSRDIESDPAAAIGACKEYLETLFKAVLDHKGVPHSQPGHIENFPDLFTKAADALGIRDETFKGNAEANEGAGFLFDGLHLIVRGIGRVRNKVGTGHGHGDSPATPAHARLIFNSTVTVAEFVAVTWDSA